MAAYALGRGYLTERSIGMVHIAFIDGTRMCMVSLGSKYSVHPLSTSPLVHFPFL